MDLYFVCPQHYINFTVTKSTIVSMKCKGRKRERLKGSSCTPLIVKSLTLTTPIPETDPGKNLFPINYHYVFILYYITLYDDSIFTTYITVYYYNIYNSI